MGDTLSKITPENIEWLAVGVVVPFLLRTFGETIIKKLPDTICKTCCGKSVLGMQQALIPDNKKCECGDAIPKEPKQKCCGECGQPYFRTCSNCGKDVPLVSPYCIECTEKHEVVLSEIR